MIVMLFMPNGDHAVLTSEALMAWCEASEERAEATLVLGGGGGVLYCAYFPCRVCRLIERDGPCYGVHAEFPHPSKCLPGRPIAAG